MHFLAENFRHYWSLFWVVGLAGAEALLYRFALRRTYPWRSCVTSLGLFVGNRVLNITTGFIIPVFVLGFFWKFRIWDPSPLGWWYYPLFFLAFEFFYYWYHRGMHEVRLFWAVHHLHHSADDLTVASSSRITWTPLGAFTGLYFLPLVLIGFPPVLVAFWGHMHTTIMTWVHVDWIPKLGPIEGLMNTPSAHRVHHAANEEYLYKNYGGILLIFDRIFGTYAPERTELPVRIGLVAPVPSSNLFVIGFYEWICIFRDWKRIPSMRTRLRMLAARPGTEF